MEDKKVKVITHGGPFHIDDVLSVAMFDLLFDGNYTLIRTRDMDVIKTGDFVMDVGGEYNPEENKFDHHQEGGAGKRPNGILYSSFGLVWKKFGVEVCGDSQEVADIIDQKIGVYIDANDNGIDSYVAREDINIYCMPKALGVFRPQFEEERTFDEGFAEALVFVKRLLEREIMKAKKFVETKEIAKKAYEEAEDKRIIIFDKYVPAMSIISSYEEPLFNVVPRDDGKWMVRSIEESDNSFVARKAFPKDWAGKRDEDLVKVTGVLDATFCHHSGNFLCIARSKEGALALAKIAVEA